jgi:hypothetical protein
MSRVTSIQYIFNVDSTEELRFSCPWPMPWEAEVFRHRISNSNKILSASYLTIRSLHLREDRHDGADQMKKSHGYWSTRFCLRHLVEMKNDFVTLNAKNMHNNSNGEIDLIIPESLTVRCSPSV